MTAKFLVLALGIFVSLNVSALEIFPKADQATCFKRVYSESHMQKNPLQLLNEMYVKVSHKSETNSSGESWTWTPAEVVGAHAGIYWGNTAGCVSRDDGSVNCFIECDGGSFDLKKSPKYAGAVNFLVHDYYFPLFKNSMSTDEEYTIENISLEGKDNNLYRLYPVDVRECDAAIQKIVANPQGGC